MSFCVDVKSRLNCFLQVKWASLSSCILVKSTFHCSLGEYGILVVAYWRKINMLMFLKQNEHLCGHTLLWNQYFSDFFLLNVKKYL